MNRLPCLLALACAVGFTGHAFAADAPSPEANLSRHQMMKECMAKQKASDGGMPKEDMKRNCRDVTETEAENAKTEKSEEKAEEKAEKSESDAGKKPASP